MNLLEVTADVVGSGNLPRAATTEHDRNPQLRASQPAPVTPSVAETLSTADAQPGAALHRELRLRPGVNHTPVRNGIRFQHWDTTFRVQGHPALHALFTRLLPQLQQGIEPELLLAGLPDSARGAARLLLTELQRRGLLVITANRPSLLELGVHTGLYTFLESLSADPPAAFQALRSVQVQLTGPADLTLAVQAHLADLGIENVQQEWTPGAVTVDLHWADWAGSRNAATAQPPDEMAPQFLGLIGADYSVLAPQYTSCVELKAALRLPLGARGPLGPAETLFCGLLALEIMREVAGLGSVTASSRAVVLEARTLQSTPMPVALVKHQATDWLRSARLADLRVQEAPDPADAAADHDAVGIQRLQRLCGDAFGLIPAPTAGAEQIPLFMYGAADRPGRRGWGADGQGALRMALERGLLSELAPAPPAGSTTHPFSALTGKPIIAPGSRTRAFPVLGYSWQDLLLRGVCAYLRASLKDEPLTSGGTVSGVTVSGGTGWSSEVNAPQQLPLEHLWLYKTLGMVYGLDAEVRTLSHPAVHGLIGVGVYAGQRLLSSAFGIDAGRVTGAALLDAVAAEQLGIPGLEGWHDPLAGTVAGTATSSGQPAQDVARALQTTLEALALQGVTFSVVPDTALAGTVQQGVFLGWVMAHG